MNEDETIPDVDDFLKPVWTREQVEQARLDRLENPFTVSSDISDLPDGSGWRLTTVTKVLT